MNKLIASAIIALASLSTQAFGCGYVLENGHYVWRCDPNPGSSSCRYVYQCGGTAPSHCEYVWDQAKGKYVLECPAGGGSSSCHNVWTCG
jgi:hypothetical protein